VLESEDEIHHRLADYPWLATEQLRTVSIEPRNILVGADRFASPDAARVIAATSRNRSRRVNA
jgi:hypothetical protein